MESFNHPRFEQKRNFRLISKILTGMFNIKFQIQRYSKPFVLILLSEKV